MPKIKDARLAALIGENLSYYRRVLGLQQKQVAAMLQIRPEQLRKYERGINRPDAVVLHQLCEILKVSPTKIYKQRKTDKEKGI